jgi:Type II secretion system (T2SS), protein G
MATQRREAMRRAITLSGYLLPAALLAIAIGWSVLVIRGNSKSSKPDPQFSTYERLAYLALDCREFHRATGRWPTSGAILTNVVPSARTNLFLDGWGRPIVFRAITNVSNEMWLISYGADGLPGGVGNDADTIQEVKP